MAFSLIAWLLISTVTVLTLLSTVTVAFLAPLEGPVGLGERESDVRHVMDGAWLTSRAMYLWPKDLASTCCAIVIFQAHDNIPKQVLSRSRDNVEWVLCG